MNNFAVISFVNVMVEIIMFLGKCFIATLCAFIALGIIDNTDSFKEGGEDEVTAAWLPGIITFLFAYVVATAFFVYVPLQPLPPPPCVTRVSCSQCVRPGRGRHLDFIHHGPR